MRNQCRTDTNNIIGMDSFGRTFGITGSADNRKQVGLFYWLWMGQPYADGIYDATKIIQQYGKEELFFRDSEKSPNGQAHWWGEPLYGYYNSADEYVIRKHMELFTIAGVDFIFFDTTNALTYPFVYQKVMLVLCDLLREGWNAPKTAFYTHSLSMKTTRKLYYELYKPKLYSDCWYYLDGKPLVIAYTNPDDDINEAASRGIKPGHQNYHKSDYLPYEQEIFEFFTFKKPQWPFDPSFSDGFPWVSWDYPQKSSGDIMNVTVASHPGVPMSFSLTRKDHINWGRGWNGKTKKNETEQVLRGQFFQQCWDYALTQQPKMITVGGFNEWIAYKQPWDGEYMLCDAASLEYSRDIEMMRGGYEDAFLIQLIQNIRRYKGTEAEPIHNMQKTINIREGLHQWESVNACYKAIGQISYGRNYPSCTKDVHYCLNRPRNNLMEIKVSYDQSYLYFLVISENVIIGDGENWMNLFIGTGPLREKGWNGYEYRINRIRDQKTGSIEAIDDECNGREIARMEYHLQEQFFQMKIPRAALRLENEMEFYFKIADDVLKPTDIMEYYVSGKSLPMGRMSYYFRMDSIS